MGQLKEKVEEVLSEHYEEITDYLISSYTIANEKRSDHTSYSTIAFLTQDEIRHYIKKYANELGAGITTCKKNRFRWHIGGLIFGFNKLDVNLKTCKVIGEEQAEQLNLFDNILSLMNTELSEENPIIIGYVPSPKRDYIQGIYIVKYKNDHSIDWSVELYKYQEIADIEQNAPELTHELSNIKIKTPDKKTSEDNKGNKE